VQQQHHHQQQQEQQEQKAGEGRGEWEEKKKRKQMKILKMKDHTPNDQRNTPSGRPEALPPAAAFAPALRIALRRWCGLSPAAAGNPGSVLAAPVA